MRIIRSSGLPAVVLVKGRGVFTVAIPESLPSHEVLELASLVLSTSEYEEFCDAVEPAAGRGARIVGLGRPRGSFLSRTSLSSRPGHLRALGGRIPLRVLSPAGDTTTLAWRSQYALSTWPRLPELARAAASTRNVPPARAMAIAPAC